MDLHRSEGRTFLNQTFSERRLGSQSVISCGGSRGELERFWMDLGGTDAKMKLSGDRSWIVKNRLVLEKTLGEEERKPWSGCFVEAFAVVRI